MWNYRYNLSHGQEWCCSDYMGFSSLNKKILHIKHSIVSFFVCFSQWYEFRRVSTYEGMNESVKKMIQ